MGKQTHYPAFNVMDQQDSWDDHTQSIVQSRLQKRGGLKYLSAIESKLLGTICTLLIDDHRQEIIDFILAHIDNKLMENAGESQRQYHVPQARDLVHDGLKEFNDSILQTYGKDFVDLDANNQLQALTQLSEGRLQPASVWVGVTQKPLFAKLLDWAVESYCSHPLVWSEIGYAGPAYPRGYMRTQIGQLEPWEAHPKHE